MAAMCLSIDSTIKAQEFIVLVVLLCTCTRVLIFASSCTMNHTACVLHFFGVESQFNCVNLRLSGAGLLLHIEVLFLLNAGIISSQVVSEALLKQTSSF